MKYLVKFFVVTFFVLICTYSQAEQKTVYIDMKYVLNNSKAGKGAQDFLKKSFEDKQKKYMDLEKTLKNGGSKSTSNKYFNINKLNAKNITLNVISKELKINKSISLQNLEFENIGNTPNSKNYKKVLRDFAEQTIKTVKKKVLSGNLQNKLKNIDEDKIKEKIKKKLEKNKNKLKNKLKKLLD